MAGGWFLRLKTGLSLTSERLVERIGHALGRGTLDAATLGELEEALISADLGPAVAQRLVEGLRGRRFDAGANVDTVRRALAEDIAKILAPVARPFALDHTRMPHVVLVVGVNGNGKTTTIGKLALRHTTAGHRVVLAAGDTFRAAAVSQLKIWGERSRSVVVAGTPGADAAALAYEALAKGRAEHADLLLIDTAGRLHNKTDLMAELVKIVRVIRKLDPSAPHDVLLVLDATTGQNALTQVDVFKSMVDVTGLVITKLDGSARGGVLVAIAEKFGLPVVAIGIGEGSDDLSEFTPTEFANSLLGIDQHA
ncbi:MAG: signal recognition particle-docking protein FtsY [Proteobacteria bacterium]|nr:signal recognition particle-docking protein FtsY [Pseudomonadota bacterium]